VGSASTRYFNGAAVSEPRDVDDLKHLLPFGHREKGFFFARRDARSYVLAESHGCHADVRQP